MFGFLCLRLVGWPDSMDKIAVPQEMRAPLRRFRGDWGHQDDHKQEKQAVAHGGNLGNGGLAVKRGNCSAGAIGVQLHYDPHDRDPPAVAPGPAIPMRRMLYVRVCRQGGDGCG